MTGIFWAEEAPKEKGAAPSLRDEVEHYTGELLKTVPLFLVGGKNAYAASALVYGLDQVHRTDSASTQMTDFGLGAFKGALTKGAFDHFGRKDWGIAAKGLSLGVSSRVLDVGLTRQTYEDKFGDFDLLSGVEKTARTALSPKMLMTDVLVFGAAHGMFKGINSATAGALERSPLMQTVGMGGTFGFVTGAGGELQRQTDAREAFDPVKVALRGFLQAGVTSVAAVPGGMQINRMPREIGTASPEQTRKGSLLSERLGSTAELAKPELTGRDLQYSSGREFRILEGKEALERFRTGEGKDGAMLKVREKLESGEGIERTLYVQHAENPIGIEANIAQLIAICDAQKLPAALAEKHVLGGTEGKLFLNSGKTPESIIFSKEPLVSDRAEAWKPIELGGKGAGKAMPAFEMLEQARHRLSRYSEAAAEDPFLSRLTVTELISDAGFESVVMRLSDGKVLKFTEPVDGVWSEEWGFRPYDAKIYNQGELDSSNGGSIHWYIQEPLTPITRSNMHDAALEEFWSKVPRNMDPWDVREGQLGYDANGKLWLLDYSAIGEEGRYVSLENEIERVRAEENDIVQTDPLDRKSEAERETEFGFEVTDGLKMSPEQRLRNTIKKENITNPHDKFLLECITSGDYKLKDLVPYAEALFEMQPAAAKEKVEQLHAVALRHKLVKK